ncbi:uncharacterized protein EV420DRAFT_1645398 [Desarmillaria tabescens]|uniref:Xylanolytic transcriptional activator regulatory domain-containing protein n=1 Tax=Armillaria tabescens TaxID=1929756 RepID=A0AA39K473_ARMTA|nr:uncharacterized protein EV420DRAFT_1645398 [Desarmillaria tabescens]KAK0452874.1 hypothetical protein EV420DRAFT_1645398 [Desarmillaria tabescens]
MACISGSNIWVGCPVLKVAGILFYRCLGLERFKQAIDAQRLTGHHHPHPRSLPQQTRTINESLLYDGGMDRDALLQRRGPKSMQHSTVLPRRKYNASYVVDLERRAEQLERMLKEHNPDILLPEGTKRYVPGGSSRHASLVSEISELDDDFTRLDLGEEMKNLSLEHSKALSERCFGPSSALALFMSALSTKKKLVGNLNAMQLQDYSDLCPWERATADAETIKHVFPDNDLITSLVAIYFEQIHPILPIMHRPTFTRDVADGLHLRDENFGATPTFRSGCCVASFGRPKAGRQLGSGLRYAVEIGLHRKKPQGYEPTIDDELKKRSFWALVTLERLFSLFDGLPIMMQEEDLDLELPVECDDEYWDIRPNGAVRFFQPANKPSIISYFNAQIRLSGIMSIVARNLYSIKKSRDMWGLTRKDEQRIVSDIDSSMNAWMNSVPDHLRWDPDNDNMLFLYQSSVLYSHYYMLQINIHRPFLRSGSSLSTPSLVMSTMAARSHSRILQVHLTRIKIISPYILTIAFMSGAVLAMNIWSRKRAGYPPNAEDLNGYKQCLDTFINASDRWYIAGCSLGMFKDLASSETASILEGMSIHALRLQETTTPVPAPALDSYWAIPDAPPELVQQYDPAYLNDSLPTGTGLPLYRTNDNPSGSSQPLVLDISESEMPGGLEAINMWTSAPPGFGFAAWDTYITNMGFENRHS